MANAYGSLRQAARMVLRDTEQYDEAVRFGVARAWLTREGDRLAERLLDEAWRWSPSPASPSSHPASEEDTC